MAQVHTARLEAALRFWVWPCAFKDKEKKKNLTGYVGRAALFTVHCSLFTVHCSLFTVHCSLFTVHCSLFWLRCHGPRNLSSLHSRLQQLSGFAQGRDSA
ncbi:hypothetical protein D4A39_06225 [Alcanivorax profundi]|uniref:Uncharacterized protein n=1 Tax=Alcanivorax profundi TaxID=2338368 RepID=A0A418XYG9_9GAMM|nr:hypothetical protein D4A39_06225 [Alcanivorax profundi]